MNKKRGPLPTSKHLIEIDIIDQMVKTITRTFDLDITAQSIVDSIVRYFQSPGGILLLVNEKKKFIFAHSTSNTPLVQKIVGKILGKSFREHCYFYDKEPLTLIGRTVKEAQIFQSQRFEDFISPEVPFEIARLIQKMANVGSIITLPVIIEQKILGVLLACFHEKEISPKQLAILSVFADYAAIAVNNAQKYEELQQQYKNLQRNYELEKETSSMLAHELKTPVAIALNNLQMSEDLLKINKNVEEEVRLVQKAKDAVLKMSRICDSVLAFREVETQKLSMVHEFHVQDSLLPVLQKFERECSKKGLGFDYDFNIKKEKIFCGGVQFEQVVTILLDNALKYTKDGVIEISIESDEKMLRCRVTDTGYGVPKDQRKKIFKRFYRGQSKENENRYKTSGIGLGLYIAKRLVQFLNGSISIEDNPKGRGSRFIVEIPVYQTSEIASEVTA